MIEDVGEPLIGGFSKGDPLRFIIGSGSAGAEKVLKRVLSPHRQSVILSQGLFHRGGNEGLQCKSDTPVIAPVRSGTVDGPDMMQ